MFTFIINYKKLFFLTIKNNKLSENGGGKNINIANNGSEKKVLLSKKKSQEILKNEKSKQIETIKRHNKIYIITQSFTYLKKSIEKDNNCNLVEKIDIFFNKQDLFQKLYNINKVGEGFLENITIDDISFSQKEKIDIINDIKKEIKNFIEIKKVLSQIGNEKEFKLFPEYGCCDLIIKNSGETIIKYEDLKNKNIKEILNQKIIKTKMKDKIINTMYDRLKGENINIDKVVTLENLKNSELLKRIYKEYSEDEKQHFNEQELNEIIFILKYNRF